VKLLVDACVWGKACDELRAAGRDVVDAGDWPEDPGDAEVLRRAKQEERIVVTLDKGTSARWRLSPVSRTPGSSDSLTLPRASRRTCACAHWRRSASNWPLARS